MSGHKAVNVSTAVVSNLLAASRHKQNKIVVTTNKRNLNILEAVDLYIIIFLIFVTAKLNPN